MPPGGGRRCLRSGGRDGSRGAVPGLPPGRRRALRYQRRRGPLGVRPLGSGAVTPSPGPAARRGTARVGRAVGAALCTVLPAAAAAPATSCRCGSGAGSSAVLLIPSVVDDSALVPANHTIQIISISVGFVKSRQKAISSSPIDKTYSCFLRTNLAINLILMFDYLTKSIHL